MSHIHLQDLPALMQRCKESLKSTAKNNMPDTYGLIAELYNVLNESLKECREEAMPAAVSAERRRELRVTVNSLVTDDSDRIDLHRAINAWMAPPKALNLESRLDLAGQYIRDVRVASAPDVRAIQSPPHLGWVATLVTDRIGNAAQTITRWAESPADALALALTDAAEWVKKTKDIK